MKFLLQQVSREKDGDSSQLYAKGFVGMNK